MTYNLLATYFWLCGLLRVSLLQPYCPYHECLCVEPTIICEDEGLQTMPPISNNQTSGLIYLIVDGTQITTVPSGGLPYNLQTTSLIDNPIASIGDAAFSGSTTTLNTLTINNARLTRIPNAFLYLHNLTELHIANVPILDWNVEAMKNIGSTLETLYIENVDLKTSPTWLQYFSRLTELSIIGSYLSSLSDSAMEMMANSLTSLSLNNNSLLEVPKALSKLKSLKTLYLKNNKISNTQWLPASSKLISIILDINRIYNASQLSISLRPFADSLDSLYLEQNQLTAIPELLFLTNIRTIDIMLNQISDSNSGSMPPELIFLEIQNNFLPTIPPLMSSLKSTTDMLLQSNKITVIRGIDFAPNATLVQLGSNLITELTDTSFPEDSFINTLYLNNNPISKISSSAFKNLPQLLELSLKSTKLTRLPLALSSLVNIYYFDITDITGLICTCQEKSLESWVLSLGPSKVDGDCGLMTIYNFFATLSAGCLID